MLNRLIPKVFYAPLSLLALLMPVGAGPAFAALEPMEEQELSGVTGEGVALGFKDFRLLFGPTSYYEAIGKAPSPAVAQLKQADGRYYGISLSGATPTSAWVGPCAADIANMGCPIGNTIPYFAAFDNPFILRVFDYSTNPSGANTLNYAGAATSQTILELLAPTSQDPWRFATWTEVRINADNANRLQGQWIMNNSKLFTLDTPGSSVASNNKIRIVKHTDTADPTVGFIWENHWQGDFRYSVNQLFTSADSYGAAPSFSNSEGFYARNIKVFMPLGQMFYQDLIFDDTAANDGNFTIELTRPGTSSTAATTDFYSVASGDTAVGGGYTRAGKPARWFETHGYFKIGDWYPVTTGTNAGAACTSCTNNTASSTADGQFFVAYDSTAAAARFAAFSDRQDTSNMDVNPIPRLTNTGNYNIVNLGDSRIDGMLIQHLVIVTRGI